MILFDYFIISFNSGAGSDKDLCTAKYKRTSINLCRSTHG